MTTEATVYLVDDDPDFVRSTKWMLVKAGLQVETFVSAEEFLENYDSDEPGCVLLDLRMPGLSGVQLQHRMKQRKWCTPVIIVTGHADVSTAVEAMEAGAAGFVEKPFSRQSLLDHIDDALKKDIELRRQQSRTAGAKARFATLTKREREVMELMVAGKATKQISSDLGASHRTIETHRSRILKKMGVQSTSQLVLLAVQDRLCDPKVSPIPAKLP